MEDQDSTPNQQLHFPNQANLISTISASRESQPTKTKVTAFKARVLKLIMLYTEKSNNLRPLLQSITQQIFLKQPQKLHTIIEKALDRSNIDNESLIELLNMYKILLMFKNKNKTRNNQFLVVFIKILKRLGEQSTNIIEEMLQTVILNRKCNLNVDFFLFLVRKMPSLKSTIIQHSKQIVSTYKIRPSQQKQLSKLQSKLSGKLKKQPQVKQQESM